MPSAFWSRHPYERRKRFSKRLRIADRIDQQSVMALRDDVPGPVSQSKLTTAHPLAIASMIVIGKPSNRELMTYRSARSYQSGMLPTWPGSNTRWLKPRRRHLCFAALAGRLRRRESRDPTPDTSLAIRAKASIRMSNPFCSLMRPAASITRRSVATISHRRHDRLADRNRQRDRIRNDRDRLAIALLSCNQVLLFASTRHPVRERIGPAAQGLPELSLAAASADGCALSRSPCTASRGPPGSP